MRDDTRPPAAKLSRAVVLLGMLGLPLLLFGVLALDVRTCLAGAIISGVAVLLHVVFTLAGW